MALGDTLRGHISARGLAALQRMEAKRDKLYTGSPAELRDMMRARGWPVNEHAIALEGLAGGLETGAGRHLGALAPLRYFDAAVRADPEFARHEPFRNQRNGAYLIGGQGKHGIYVLADGSIQFERDGDFCVDGDEDGRAEVVFDSFLQLIEVAALTRDSVLWAFDGTDPIGWHRVWLDRPLGEPIAEALGAAPFDAATGSHCAAWLTDSCHVVERRSEHFFNDTTIGTPDPIEATEAVRIALEQTRDLVWIAPRGTVTRAVLHRLPTCGHGGGAGIDIYAWGQPSGYWPRQYDPQIHWPESLK